MIVIDKLKLFYSKYPRLSALYPFFITLAVNMVILLRYPYKFLFGDAGGYMDLSKLFIVDGHFSLLNYHDILRGYFLPLILQVPIQLSNLTGLDELTCYRFIAAIIATVCFTVLFPRCFEEFFNFRAMPWAKLIFALLITFFWYGNYAYPLSDFPALTFYLLGLTLFLIAVRSGRGLWAKGGLIMTAGVCLAAAASIRISYLIPLFISLVLLLLRLLFSKNTMIARSLLPLLLIAGCVIVFVPQALSNKIHYQENTPFQINKLADNTTLLQTQLLLGFLNQRVDFGNIESPDQNVPELFVPDYQGRELVKKYAEKYGINASNLSDVSVAQLARIAADMAAHQPIDIAAIYVRHLLNGLDIVYPYGYVPDFHSRDRIIYRFVNYTLWFLAISLLWRRGINLRREKDALIGCFILMLPAVIAIPSLVEIRFFLPIYILLYACVSFMLLSKQEHRKQLLTRRSIIGYVCFTVICFVWSSYLLSTVGILLQN
jgi:hypothetical protein